MKRVIYETTGAGFPIRLECQKHDSSNPDRDRFRVVYGAQTDSDLTYGRAAAKLGEAIMHACACEGKMDP